MNTFFHPEFAEELIHDDEFIRDKIMVSGDCVEGVNAIECLRHKKVVTDLDYKNGRICCETDIDTLVLKREDGLLKLWLKAFQKRTRPCLVPWMHIRASILKKYFIEDNRAGAERLLAEFSNNNVAHQFPDEAIYWHCLFNRRQLADQILSYFESDDEMRYSYDFLLTCASLRRQLFRDMEQCKKDLHGVERILRPQWIQLAFEWAELGEMKKSRSCLANVSNLECKWGECLELAGAYRRIFNDDTFAHFLLAEASAEHPDVRKEKTSHWYLKYF